MSETEQQLAEFISQEILHAGRKSTLPVNAPLIEGGVLDSMGLQQLVTFIEVEYEIEVAANGKVLEVNKDD